MSLAGQPQRVHPSVEALEERMLLSATLLQDINRTTANALEPRAFNAGMATVNNTVFFAADDGVHGSELWKSDGTSAGTKLVKDINPGLGSSAPSTLVTIGNTVYFGAHDGVHGAGLWASDGTAAGTRLVKAITPDPVYFLEGVSNLTAAGTTLFFTTANGSTGFSLWKSDGTTTGTVSLGAFTAPGIWPPGPGLTALGNSVYFSAADAERGQELWTSNGTTAGTRIIKDINPGAAGSTPSALAVAAGRLWFSADDGEHGFELWTSNGTAAGTRLVKDLNGNTPVTGELGWPGSSHPSGFTAVGNTVFFSADDGASGVELWQTDGSALGTALVADLHAGGYPLGAYPWYQGNSSGPSGLTAFDGKLYFSADDGEHGVELWRSDGVTTEQVADLNLASQPWFPEMPGSSSPSNLTVVGGRLLFAASDGDGIGLWATDGKSAPTQLQGAPPDGTLLGASMLTRAGNRLFFANDDGSHGVELWYSDGTAASTKIVRDINTVTSNAEPQALTRSGNQTFFVANDGVRGLELWRTDGSTGGTRLVKDIAPGRASSGPRSLTDVNGTLYFSASSENFGFPSLWKSDGTSAGTVALADVSMGDGVVFKNRFFFSGINPGNYTGALWTSDGTTAGTVPIVLSFTWLSNLTIVGDSLYFTASDGVHGGELWKSDGTAAGTKMVKDINSGSADAGIMHLTAVGNRLFFAADDGTHGTELWVSDGTSAGTHLVKDIEAGSASGFELFMRDLTTVPIDGGGVLYFVADDGTHGTELWRSDGTAAGTRLVKDIQVGPGSSFGYNPGNLSGPVRMGNAVYFMADDGVHGGELWKTDGTEAGTRLVKDIVPGVPSPDPFESDALVGSYPTSLVVLGDRLYFMATDADHGGELWQSDGTAAGTRMVQDVNPGPNSSSPSNLFGRAVWKSGGAIYFAATDPQHGQELWCLPSNRAPTPSAGGPYTVREGEALTLDASRSADSDGDRLTYTWDVNGDGIFGDATGVRPTLSAGRLGELGLRGGPQSSRVRVRVDDGQGNTVTADATLTVQDAPLAARAVPVTAVEATEFRGVVATFTDPGGPERTANYSASIDWGDGLVSIGTIKLSGDRFEVNGRHTYGRRGDYRVRVTIRDQGGSPATAVGAARVADAPITVSGVAFRPTEGVSFNGVVGQLRDSNPYGKATEFRATIDWGDGQRSTAVLTSKGRGVFEMRGTHTYSREGTYTVILQVLSDGGNSAATTLRVTVGKRRS